jgi:hypothetical protein
VSGIVGKNARTWGREQKTTAATHVSVSERLEPNLICLLDVFKNDFGEVDEAIFHSVERPCEFIFYILVIENRYLDEAASETF